MQTFRTDSPEAAARVLAMALVADGHYSMAELKAVDRLGIPHKLGLEPQVFQSILEQFCMDLLATADGQWCAGVPADVRDQLLSEVRDPALREQVREYAQAIMQADGHLADGEVLLMDKMAGTWRERMPTHQASAGRAS